LARAPAQTKGAAEAAPKSSYENVGAAARVPREHIKLRKPKSLTESMTRGDLIDALKDLRFHTNGPRSCYCICNLWITLPFGLWIIITRSPFRIPTVHLK
jgi:hypothetical protein